MGGGLARYCFLKYISCCEVILFFAVCKQPGTEEYGLKLINFPIISFEEDTIQNMGIYVYILQIWCRIVKGDQCWHEKCRRGSTEDKVNRFSLWINGKLFYRSWKSLWMNGKLFYRSWKSLWMNGKLFYRSLKSLWMNGKLFYRSWKIVAKLDIYKKISFVIELFVNN